MKDKMVVYQIFTRLFGNTDRSCIHNGSIRQNGCGKMNDISTSALNKIKELGITHVWYTGVIAHATQTDYTKYGLAKDHPAVVKGKAGSPYAIKDYYDIDPDLAVKVENRMDEFKELVNRTHKSGMKVIIDFVPNHVSRQYHSLAKPENVKDLGEDDNTGVSFEKDNNFYYIPGQKLGGEINLYDEEQGEYIEQPAKATGNNHFDAYPGKNDWFETIKLNYGVDYYYNTGCHFDPVPDTWTKMKDILLFWAEKGIDGFRCDMAEMVPCEFWGWAIPKVKEEYPEIIFIAEVYNPNEYRNYIHNGHFDYLYDKVGLYDTLRAVTCGYGSAMSITNCWQNVNDIQEHMLNFLENHDEQRVASDFFAGNANKGIPALIVSACMNTNPMMIYFGQELGEKGMDNEGYSGCDGRTTIFDYWSVDTIRRWNGHGSFSDKALSQQEIKLRNTYKTILNLSISEDALSKGEFFDLMYANAGKWQMNEHKEYTFIRKYKDEIILVIVNFDQIPVQTAVTIPQHAFDYLKMPVCEKCTAVDLLTGKEENIAFCPQKNVNTLLPASGGKIFKIKCK